MYLRRFQEVVFFRKEVRNENGTDNRTQCKR